MGLLDGLNNSLNKWTGNQAGPSAGQSAIVDSDPLQPGLGGAFAASFTGQVPGFNPDAGKLMPIMRSPVLDVTRNFVGSNAHDPHFLNRLADAAVILNDPYGPLPRPEAQGLQRAIQQAHQQSGPNGGRFLLEAFCDLVQQANRFSAVPPHVANALALGVPSMANAGEPTRPGLRKQEMTMALQMIDRLPPNDKLPVLGTLTDRLHLVQKPLVRVHLFELLTDATKRSSVFATGVPQTYDPNFGNQGWMQDLQVKQAEQLVRLARKLPEMPAERPVQQNTGFNGFAPPPMTMNMNQPKTLRAELWAGLMEATQSISPQHQKSPMAALARQFRFVVIPFHEGALNDRGRSAMHNFEQQIRFIPVEHAADIAQSLAEAARAMPFEAGNAIGVQSTFSAAYDTFHRIPDNEGRSRALAALASALIMLDPDSRRQYIETFYGTMMTLEPELRSEPILRMAPYIPQFAAAAPAGNHAQHLQAPNTDITRQYLYMASRLPPHMQQEIQRSLNQFAVEIRTPGAQGQFRNTINEILPQRVSDFSLQVMREPPAQRSPLFDQRFELVRPNRQAPRLTSPVEIDACLGEFGALAESLPHLPPDARVQAWNNLVYAVTLTPRDISEQTGGALQLHPNEMEPTMLQLVWSLPETMIRAGMNRAAADRGPDWHYRDDARQSITALERMIGGMQPDAQFRVWERLSYASSSMTDDSDRRFVRDYAIRHMGRLVPPPAPSRTPQNNGQQ